MAADVSRGPRWWLRALIAAPVAFLVLLVVEAIIALSAEYLPTEPDYTPATLAHPDGTVDDLDDRSIPADALRVAVLGDSTVAGVGSPDLEGSLVAQIAERLAVGLDRPVAARGLGVSGARLGDVLGDQADALEASQFDPDVVIAVVGSNDVTHATPPWAVRRDAEAMVHRLDDAADGATVVVAGVPLFGGADALPGRLRWVVSRYATVVRDRQRAGVEAAGGTHVEIHRDASPRFRGIEDAMSVDGFHPAPTGYGFWADAIVNDTREALLRRS